MGPLRGWKKIADGHGREEAVSQILKMVYAMDCDSVGRSVTHSTALVHPSGSWLQPNRQILRGGGFLSNPRQTNTVTKKTVASKIQEAGKENLGGAKAPTEQRES